MKIDRAQVDRANRVQEQIQTFLLLTFPFTSIDVIVTALTYEIARMVGAQMPFETDVDAVLEGVVAVMKEQIKAHRDGRLPP